jgi:hypothetical protein
VLRRYPSTSSETSLPFRPLPAFNERAPSGRTRTSTTPGRLRTLLVVITAGSCLLWLAGGAAVVLARAEVDDLGHRRAPAVFDALRLHAELADADRLAANDFLLGSQVNTEKRQEYELDLTTATRDLEQAAELNEPGGPAGIQLRQIAAMLAQFNGLVETARVSAHSPSLSGAASLRQASDLMHRPRDGILARVDTLGTTSSLGRVQDDTRLWFVGGTVVAFFVIALALLGWLVYTQTFLRIRFRRRSSPPILAAASLLVILSAWVAWQSFTTYRNLSVAQGVAFTELHRLSLMRSLAADANADESLSLIAPGNSAVFDNDFKSATDQLVSPPLTDDMAQAAVRGDIRFSGLLADEFHDAASANDRAATVRVLRGYQEFLAVDASFRSKAMAGKYDDATALVVGSTQFGTAFADLDIALDRRIDVEQAKFDSAVADASPGLDTDVGIGLGAVAIALLALWALRPRMAEYRA